MNKKVGTCREDSEVRERTVVSTVSAAPNQEQA